MVPKQHTLPVQPALVLCASRAVFQYSLSMSADGQSDQVTVQPVCSQEHADKKEVLQALSSQQQQQDATATYTTSTSKVGNLTQAAGKPLYLCIGCSCISESTMVIGPQSMT